MAPIVPKLDAMLLSLVVRSNEANEMRPLFVSDGHPHLLIYPKRFDNETCL